MADKKLFSTYRLGPKELKNRIVMSPLTRCRAIGNIPNDLMATYYAQRAGAGMLISEGIAPSPNGLGYARIPGIFNQEQINGWKKVTDAVHAKGGLIAAQFMHTGRVSHSLNLPAGARVLAPSAVRANGDMWTDAQGMQPLPVPEAMTTAEVEMAIKEHVEAAKNAMAAGFDAVELHGANGYLSEQFLSSVTNVRTDKYGGSVENRARFLLETIAGIAKAIGKEKVGVRLSPYGTNAYMEPYPEVDQTHTYLAEQLSSLGILYIHLIDPATFGGAAIPALQKTIREKFNGALILAGGYQDAERSNKAIEGNFADLIAFGRPFINNPDLPNRLKNNHPVDTAYDSNIFYSADAKGYTDYPAHQ